MAKARVYFTREITPQAMDRLYDALGIRLSGKTAVKISTGEPGGHNFLQPALIGPLTERLHGTIGYADFSQVGDLGTVAVKVGDKYNEISAEAGSKVIGDSKQDDTVKGDNRIVIKINHATEAEGAYPIVLVSYDIVCPAYKDTKQAEFAKAWLTYVTSDEGQKAAQDAAGTAPLPSSLKSEITKSIEAIKTK